MAQATASSGAMAAEAAPEAVPRIVTPANSLVGPVLRSTESQKATSFRRAIPKIDPQRVQLIDSFVKEAGGDNPIYSVLIANNGLAAVKFIQGIRAWGNQVLGSSKAVTLVAMATPNDIRINAEHIQLADQFVEVPGGTNNNNYANVPLIVQVAQRAGVGAVWPGWGHASENPELPAALHEAGITFLGPGAVAMAALGDKIGSTILAQAAGVPTLPWSGSGVCMAFADCKGVIPEEVYAQACIQSVEDAVERCNAIGYPVMLKASWGGGGKGIRKVYNAEDVQNMFKQIQGEVPGSPVFAMAFAPASRHLEVQLLCDRHGNVASLMSRDCSIQRRHQKIVEEGPVVAASQEDLKKMEKCARALARSVGYVGAATVEFLYDIKAKNFYFLELNPRLQVEHPVSEEITGVRLPAAQFQIGMGIPLWRIPSIRCLFCQDPKEVKPFDMEETPQKEIDCHVVAVRITSEDANDGFKPTCGRIDELHFRATPDVWGYFSVKGGGGIHEFSDSQFGHVFARGQTRAHALRMLVGALKDVVILGEVRNSIDYCIDMLQCDDFVANNVHTGWLDARIASKLQAGKLPWHLAVIAGAVVRTHQHVATWSAEYLAYLNRGQLPPSDISLTRFHEVLVIEGLKYEVDISRHSPDAFCVSLNNSHVDVMMKNLADGGFLIQVDATSHVVHAEEQPMGTRIIMGSRSTLLSKDVDPSRLVAASPCKLVRCLVSSGTHIQANTPYAEVEVMKMVMQLVVPAAGVIQFVLSEGAVVAAGDLIARLQFNDEDAAQAGSVAVFGGVFPELEPPAVPSGQLDQIFRLVFANAKNVMAGYVQPAAAVLDDLIACLDSPELALLQWGDAYSVVRKHIPSHLATTMENIVSQYSREVSQWQSGVEACDDNDAPGLASVGKFPAKELADMMEAELKDCPAAGRALLETNLAPLLDLARRHAGGNEKYARSIIVELLEDFLRVEEAFHPSAEASTEQDITARLKAKHGGNLNAVIATVVAHQGLPDKCELVMQILSRLVMPAPEQYSKLLHRLADLGTNGTQELKLRAQQLLEHSLLADLRAVVARALSGLDMFSTDDECTNAALGHGLSSPVPAMRENASFQASMPRPGIEAKIAMLVSAPAAVEDALMFLLTEKGVDRVLRERAAVTYIRRIYHHMLLQQPHMVALPRPAALAGASSTASDGILSPTGGSLSSMPLLVASPRRSLAIPSRRSLESKDGRAASSEDHLSNVASIWMFNEPTTCSTSAARSWAGVLLVVESLQQLPAAAKAAKVKLDEMGLSDVSTALHVAITGGLSGLAHLADADADESVCSVGEVAGPSISIHKDSMDSGSADRSAARQADQALTAFMAGSGGGQVLSLNAASVSFMFKGDTCPALSGFVWDCAAKHYRCTSFLHQLDSLSATLLEVGKLRSYKSLTYSTSRDRQWHMYQAAERPDPSMPELRRLFARALLRDLDSPALLAASYSGDPATATMAAVTEVEGLLVRCLEELSRLQEVVPAATQSAHSGQRPDVVHLFFNVLPPLPLQSRMAKDEARAAAAMRSAVAGLVAQHISHFRRAAVAEWEVRFCGPRSGTASMSGAWRVVVALPSGHEHGEEHVHVYRERLAALEPEDEVAISGPMAPLPQRVYEALRGTSSTSCGLLHQQDVMSCYPALELLQRKRLVARRHNVTYCYDFPGVIENALREMWAERVAAGEPGFLLPAGPLVEFEELVCEEGASYRKSNRLRYADRPHGSNNCGMVAFYITVKTPEVPQGRHAILVANDITYQSGAFSPREDAVFKAAVEMALEEKLPLVYLAANSGARVGLATEVFERLKVQWTDPADPSRGLKYLYLSKDDYHHLTTMAELQGSPLVLRARPQKAPPASPAETHGSNSSDSEEHWVLTDIVGLEDGLGVECLSGSAALASTYNRAFREGYTITMVSGRTVGIGAYLARLGRRCIQRTDQPIILTGFAALNKLLGRKVYTSHMQLGGPRVMGINGVSHHLAADDLDGVKTILRLLSYAPAALTSAPPALPTHDPVGRVVAYAPSSTEKLDPYAAIAGIELLPPFSPSSAESGQPKPSSSAPTSSSPPSWLSGLFDRGSWLESQAGWAQTVVTGRARLGGQPVGVIAVQPSAVTRILPADPGVPDSVETSAVQAGQVWYPDSAAKTAAAIEEYNLEGLPLFILANWRGFSGGLKDLFDGVLQAGSLIVESLRKYRQPVFVYIPCGAELRGGAWVVVDSQINSTQIEMYADPTARGGVLEPEGVVEIKCRPHDLTKLMRRIDPTIRRLAISGSPDSEKEIKAREKQLMPVYHQVARQFADMHDTPVRMLAKGVIRGIVPWAQSRRFFCTRLKRRLAEELLLKHIHTTDASMPRDEALSMVHTWYAHSHSSSGGMWQSASSAGEGVSPTPNSPHKSIFSTENSVGAERQAGADLDTLYLKQQEEDEAFLLWSESGPGRAQVGSELKALKAHAATQSVAQLLTTAEGKEGTLKALQAAVQTDVGLAVQLRLLLGDTGLGRGMLR